MTTDKIFICLECGEEIPESDVEQNSFAGITSANEVECTCIKCTNSLMKDYKS